MIWSPKQYRVPNQNNIVGARQCLGLILATNNSDATGIDITYYYLGHSDRNQSIFRQTARETLPFG
jgi:hypothetical protein